MSIRQKLPVGGHVESKNHLQLKLKDFQKISDLFLVQFTLRKKCLYTELFWSIYFPAFDAVVYCYKVEITNSNKYCTRNKLN